MKKQGNVKKVTLSPKDVRKQAVKKGNPAGAIQADLKRKAAIDLRLAGCTFDEIGEAIGVSGKTAHVYVTDGWERIQAETDEARLELRDLELARINRQYRRLFPVATANNLQIEKTKITADGPLVIREEDLDWQIKASAECRKLSEQRAKLLGLYAPTKIETNAGSSIEPIEVLAARVAEQKGQRAAEKSRAKTLLRK